jgi:hypothetical protein
VRRRPGLCINHSRRSRANANAHSCRRQTRSRAPRHNLGSKSNYTDDCGLISGRSGAGGWPDTWADGSFEGRSALNWTGNSNLAGGERSSAETRDFLDAGLHGVDLKM